MRKFALFILLMVGLGQAAHGANINGTLQQEFTCPAANCTSSCSGSGGQLTISGYTDLSAWMIGQPDRLWLQKTDAQNNVSITVLGVGDRCTFAGTPLIIGQQPSSSSLGPPPTPSCFCANGFCNPPGCGPASH